MSYSQIREPGSFGKRAPENSVVFTRNGKSHQFRVNPIFATFLGSVVFLFMIGYFGATAYLVFRDDLIAASYAKQARMKHEYEDRLGRQTRRRLRLKPCDNFFVSLGSRNPYLIPIEVRQ